MSNSCVRWRTNVSSSWKEPGSSSFSTRSRAVYLPRSCCLATAALAAGVDRLVAQLLELGELLLVCLGGLGAHGAASLCAWLLRRSGARRAPGSGARERPVVRLPEALERPGEQRLVVGRRRGPRRAASTATGPRAPRARARGHLAARGLARAIATRVGSGGAWTTEAGRPPNHPRRRANRPFGVVGPRAALASRPLAAQSRVRARAQPTSGSGSSTTSSAAPARAPPQPPAPAPTRPRRSAWPSASPVFPTPTARAAPCRWRARPPRQRRSPARAW